MGCDDLFKKRKARKIKEQQRKSGVRKTRDKVLIVCEGERTEPLYFEELKKEYHLSSADVVVTDADNGSDPMSVVQCALGRLKDSKNRGDAFDQVFCVFDKDQHAHFNSAVLMLERKEYRNICSAITSVPCFEYWFLLHFTDSTQPFYATGKNTASYSVIQTLKKYMPYYEKNKKVFDALKNNINTAIKNAELANKVAAQTGTDNPSTKVVELVKYLIELGKY